LQLPICADEYAQALQRLADQIGVHLRKPCITQRVAKRAGTDQDDCSVVTHTRNDQGQFVDSVVPACADTSGAGPCWQLVAGEDGCTGQSIDVVPDATAPMPTSQHATVECALCMAGGCGDARGCP